MKKLAILMFLAFVLVSAVFGQRGRYSSWAPPAPVFTKKINSELKTLPVRVPEGVGIVCLSADDPLMASFDVFYIECRRRGLPVTLNAPSMMSRLSPVGLASTYNYYRMSDAKFSEVLTRGGGCYIYHSTSHSEPPNHAGGDAWLDFDILGTWYKSEVTGADYREPISALSNTAAAVRQGLTPGDRVNVWLETVQDNWEAGEYATNSIVAHNDRNWIATTTTSDEPAWAATDWKYAPLVKTADAKWITCQGLSAPGDWQVVGGQGWIPPNSECFEAAAERWGFQQAIYPGSQYGDIPRKTIMHKWTGLPSDLNSTAQNRAFIDTIIADNKMLICFSHDWYAAGEDETTDGGGSAKSGSTGYDDSGRTPEYDKLIDFLDYIKLKVDAGTLVALGVGAGMSATEGTVEDIWGYGEEDLYPYMERARDTTAGGLSAARQMIDQACISTNGSANLVFYLNQEWGIDVVGKQITLTSGLTSTIVSRSADRQTVVMNTVSPNGSSNADYFVITAVSYPTWAAGQYVLEDTVINGGAYYVAEQTTSNEPPHADWTEITQIDVPNIANDARHYFLLNRRYTNRDQTQEWFGLWGFCGASYANESWIFNAYARVPHDIDVYPVVFIYGASEEWPMYNDGSADVLVSGATTIIDIGASRTPAALLDQPLYQFTLDGNDCMLISHSLDIVSVADGGGGTTICTVNYAHQWEDSDSITITETTNHDGTYSITNADGLVFTIADAYVEADTGKATDGKNEFKQVRIPFTLPKPIQRIGILLSATYVDGVVQWAGPITITPNGPGSF